MKKLFSILILLLIPNVYAQTCNIKCPSESLNIIEGETILNKITGINFVSKKIIELAIQKEINDELEKSKVNATLDIFNLKRLKNGEFKSLKIKTENFKYRALSMSNFSAETYCNYNNFLYKNKKIYFPTDIPFKFEGEITNTDIQNVINSYEFQKELKRNNIIQNPKVIIQDNFLHFTIPIKSFISFNIKFKANVEVANNKIVLRNITFNSNSNIINNDIFAPLLNNINPITYEFDSVNGKFFNIDITKATILEDKIKINGILNINKNYGERNE